MARRKVKDGQPPILSALAEIQEQACLWQGVFNQLQYANPEPDVLETLMTKAAQVGFRFSDCINMKRCLTRVLEFVRFGRGDLMGKYFSSDADTMHSLFGKNEERMADRLLELAVQRVVQSLPASKATKLCPATNQP
jgi:hypothetical protein